MIEQVFSVADKGVLSVSDSEPTTVEHENCHAETTKLSIFVACYDFI
jgi:hypothetical protein